jgi:hypothetical protein
MRSSINKWEIEEWRELIGIIGNHNGTKVKVLYNFSNKIALG